MGRPFGSGKIEFDVNGYYQYSVEARYFNFLSVGFLFSPLTLIDICGCVSGRVVDRLGGKMSPESHKLFIG